MIVSYWPLRVLFIYDLINNNDRKRTNVNGPIPPCTLCSKQTKSDNHLPAIKTSFKWRVAGPKGFKGGGGGGFGVFSDIFIRL